MSPSAEKTHCEFQLRQTMVNCRPNNCTAAEIPILHVFFVIVCCPVQQNAPSDRDTDSRQIFGLTTIPSPPAPPI